ncbi:MAG: DNA translocase FtsK 4TM domain-containing protein, partial [Clostridiales Family XIII bacterium]|nr:DNA translocase FtsK 4TM domain-containing protein [Clostridiales Family XIII bacterium]
MAVKNKTTAGGRGRRARTAKSPASDEQPKKFDEKPAASGRLKDEIWAIVVVAVGVFFAVALQTPAAGQLGAVIKTVMTGIFGATAYLLPYCMIFYGILVFAKKTVRAGGRSAVFLLLIFLMITVINAAGFIDPASISFSFDTISGLFGDGVKGNSGGFLGALTAMAFVSLLGKVGLYIFCTVLICISLLLVINTPLSQFFDAWKTRREEKRLLAEADGVFEPEGNGGMGGVYGNPGLAAGGAKPASEPGKKRRKGGGSEKKGKYSETGDAYGGYDIFEANARKRTIAERRTRILDYMNDDSLFEKNAEGFQEDPEAPDLFDVFKEAEEIAVSAPAYEDAPESSSGAEAGHGAKTSAKEPPAAGARKNFRYAFPPLSLLNKGPSS